MHILTTSTSEGAKENEEISLGPSVQSRPGEVAFERNGVLLHLAGQVHKGLLTAFKNAKSSMMWSSVTLELSGKCSNGTAATNSIQ